MDLGDETDVPVLEPLDDRHLPQRAATVELPAGDVGGQLGQLAQPARLGRDDAPDVPAEVEVRVLDPDRMVQAQWHVDQPSAERRKQVEPIVEHLLEALEAVAAGNRRGIEHRDLQRVHVQRWRLHVEEARVEPGVGERVPMGAVFVARVLAEERPHARVGLVGQLDPEAVVDRSDGREGVGHDGVDRCTP